MYNKNGNIGASVPDNKQLSRLLRIKVLFLLAAIGLSGSVAAQTSSPNARISLDLQNVPLKEVFARIEDQSNYIFVYYDSILDASRRVSISVSDQPVGNVLEVLFAGTENTWKLSGRQIVIGKAAAAGKAEKQTPLRVMGSVKDTNGEPLIGVTVFVKERPSVGTATDINGNYLIDVQTDDVLEFSYVGYKTQDVAVAGRGLLDIVLEQNDAILDAVEVVGYGVQKKISVIGSQQSIQVKELKVPVANLTQGLAGRVAGLVSVQRTSEPGFDDADIYIRGISTLTASMSAPLTLVDGVPRSFANVDPEDIESFSILKDASATAVYGVRGANGVIIINTKSGSKGRPKFTVRYTEGITTPTKITDFVDGATYMEMSNEASMTRGGGALYSREVIEKTRTHADPYLYPNVDWMDEILRDYSHNRSANVNVSGGSDKAVYYIGLAYYDEDGMYKDTKLSDYNSNTYYRRYNVTTNLTLNPFRTTEIKLGIQGYLANANYPASAQSTIFESAYFTQPTYIAPLYPDGKLGAFSGGELNPVAELGATGYANQWRSQVYSNLRITQQLYKGLSITGMFSFDTYNYTSNRFTKSPNTYHATGRDANGNLIYEQTRQGTENLAYSLSAKGDRTIYLEAALNYKNTFRATRRVGYAALQPERRDQHEGDQRRGGPALPLPRSGRTLHLRIRRPLLRRIQLRIQRLGELHPQEPLRFLPLGGSGLGDLQRVILRATHERHPIPESPRHVGSGRKQPDQRPPIRLPGHRNRQQLDELHLRQEHGSELRNDGHRRICRRRDVGGGRQDRHRRGHAPVEQQAQPPIRLLQGVPRGHLPPPFEHSFLRRNDQQPLRQYRKGREQGLPNSR